MIQDSDELSWHYAFEIFKEQMRLVLNLYLFQLVKFITIIR